MEMMDEGERAAHGNIPRDFIPPRSEITAPEWDACYDAALQRANVPDPEVAAQAIADLQLLKDYLHG